MSYTHSDTLHLRQLGKFLDRNVEQARRFFPWPGVIFVLDLRTGNYLHLSNHFPEITQHHYEPLKEHGFEYFYHIMNQKDIAVYDTLFRNRCGFVSTFPAHEVEQYWFTSNYRINLNKQKAFHV